MKFIASLKYTSFVLIFFAFLGTVSKIEAQVPGYLGKKTIIEFGWAPLFDKMSDAYTLNVKRHQFSGLVEYVTGRYTSLFAKYSYWSNENSINDKYYDPFNTVTKGEYYDLNFHNFKFGYKTYADRNSSALAPLGAYVGLWLNYCNINGEGRISKDSRSTDQFGLGFNLGSKHIIADKFTIDYGFEMNAYTCYFELLGNAVSNEPVSDIENERLQKGFRDAACTRLFKNVALQVYISFGFIF